MRLQDAIQAAEPYIVKTSDGKLHTLPGASDIAGVISNAPARYVLDDSSAALVTNTAYAEKNPVADALDIIRIPSTAFWMEWSDRGRAAIMQQLGAADPFSATSRRGRAGALVHADESGRRGNITMVWENHDSEPEMSPFLIEFDFDNHCYSLIEEPNIITRSLQLRTENPLQALFDCTRFRLNEQWNLYYRAYAHRQAQFDGAVQKNLEVISGDIAFVAAFCLVLSARGALHYQQSELAKLNAARARKGARPLLDHMNVALDLGPASGNESDAEREIFGRSAPRLHHVCGHLVRRGNSLFWRRPHMRGNPKLGLVSTRTFEVRSGRRQTSN